MQWILLAIIIFVAIWAWPITLSILIIWIVVGTTINLVKTNNKKNSIRRKQANIDSTVPKIREALDNDRVLLVSVIASVIKQHWDTLEGKFENYIFEDDYGNTYLNSGIKKEFVYFSEKIVIPELLKHIDMCESKDRSIVKIINDAGLPSEIIHQLDFAQSDMNSLIFILQDTIYVLENIPGDYFGIKFDDSNDVIAKKMLTHIHERSVDDELLYDLVNNQELKDQYLNQVQNIFMNEQSITLLFTDKLKTTEPMVVTVFVSLIFTIFTAMHNTKSNARSGIDSHEMKKIHEFTGNDPYKYEEFVKSILRYEGFSATKTRGSGDYGVDVIAKKNNRTYAIQCKLYNRPVGTKAVQEIISGRIFYHADYAIVVSDNSFTDAAKILARKTDVILTHHKNLVNKLDKLTESKRDIQENSKIIDNKTDDPLIDNIYEDVDEHQRKLQETEELITVILPVINNDK